MKYLNFILTVIAISIIILAYAVQNTALPNRYIFRNPHQEEFLATKCEVLDTATGKIYFWNERVESPTGEQRSGTIEIADPINNTLIRQNALKTKIK